jgi:hypothetical protein
VHRALDRAQQIETELGAELAQIEAALQGQRPCAGEDLGAEVQAAKRAREPCHYPRAIQDGRARRRQTTSSG